MTTISRIMLVGAVAVVAAGCTKNLPGGSLAGTFTAANYLATPIEGQGFNAELARAYQRVAAFNSTSPVNWLDTTVYIGRSQAAAAGTPMELFVPAEFGVNSDLEALRGRVIAAVGANASTNPQACAEAMAFYDHLVEVTYQLPGAGQSLEQARAQFDAALSACEGIVVGDMTVFFGFDRADLTAAAQSVIQEVVDMLGGTGRPVSVVGHTDTVGSLAYNQGLSERRANAVANRMVQLGVPRETITTAGRSWLEPAVDTGPNVREQRNRRVEITVSD